MNKLKVSGRKVSTSKTKCIDKVDKVSVSITQIQKLFPKGRPKIVGGTMFTNFLLLHDKDIDDITQDMRYQLDEYNTKLEV